MVGGERTNSIAVVPFPASSREAGLFAILHHPYLLGSQTGEQVYQCSVGRVRKMAEGNCLAIWVNDTFASANTQKVLGVSDPFSKGSDKILFNDGTVSCR